MFILLSPDFVEAPSDEAVLQTLAFPVLKLIREKHNPPPRPLSLSTHSLPLSALDSFWIKYSLTKLSQHQANIVIQFLVTLRNLDFTSF